MVEVRRQGQRVEAEVTTLDRATGAAPPARLEPRPGGRRQSPPDLRGTAERVAPGRRPARRAARRSGPRPSPGDTVVRVDLDRPAPAETRAELARIFADRFSADESKRATARKLLAELPWDESMRELAWAAYKASPAHEPLRREFEAKTVATKDRKSPYLWRHVGQKPAGGWALVIAMHGGGGAPKRVNDQQWQSMFERYYKEHPEAGGYVYLALRAPNDEWNGFYDDAICPLVERLIRQFVLFGDVDPDRVYILGASHGGYGAFVIGPKMPDRFAAIHASAAAPTDGETHGENLRDVRFTVMVGDKDTAYGRADRCRAFIRDLEGWKARVRRIPRRGDDPAWRRPLGARPRQGGRDAQVGRPQPAAGPARSGRCPTTSSSTSTGSKPRTRPRRAGSRPRCMTIRSRSRPSIRTRSPSGSTRRW